MGSDAGNREAEQPPVLDPGARRRTGPAGHRAIGVWSHGIIDYVIVIILITGPSIAGFAGRQATWAYLLGALLFVLTIFTRFPLGVVKVVSFAMHGMVEILLALLLLFLPWMANFARGIHSRNFYVAVAILMLIVWGMTDFRGVRDRA